MKDAPEVTPVRSAHRFDESALEAYLHSQSAEFSGSLKKGSNSYQTMAMPVLKWLCLLGKTVKNTRTRLGKWPPTKSRK